MESSHPKNCYDLDPKNDDYRAWCCNKHSSKLKVYSYMVHDSKIDSSGKFACVVNTIAYKGEKPYSEYDTTRCCDHRS